MLDDAPGLEKGRNRPAEGAFRERRVLLKRMSAPMPAGVAFEAAAVPPLGLSTAACALFQKNSLTLAPPSLDPVPPAGVVLVWGGCTSVGGNAI